LQAVWRRARVFRREGGMDLAGGKERELRIRKEVAHAYR